MEPVGQLPVTAAAATDAPEAAIGRTQTFFVFIAGADAGDHESVCLCTEERDWKDLLPELVVSKVAEFALRSEVTDYIRLRAVCKSWRVVAKADPRFMGMDPSVFPRNWDIVNGGARREKTRFVHALTGAFIWLQIPLEYGEVIASAEGCLILASGRGCDQKLRLFNPVTRAVAHLPALPCGSMVTSAGFIYNDGEADADPTVVLCAVDHMKRITYAKPGDTAWQIVDEEEYGEMVPYSGDGSSVRGKFYVPTPRGDLRRLELRPQPHLVYVARQEPPHSCDSYFRVVRSDADDGGMLLLRFFADNIEVFRVDFTAEDEGTLTLVKEQEVHDRCFSPLLTLGSKQVQ